MKNLFLTAAALLFLGFCNAQTTQSLTFDNGTSMVDLTDQYLPNGNSPRTLELWIRIDSWDWQDRYYFSYGGTIPGQGWSLGTWFNGQVVFTQIGGTLTSNADISDGLWHHVAVSYDGTMYNMYIDGQLDNSTNTLFTDTQLSTARIGGYVGNTSQSAIGDCDEIRMWDIALTQIEIQDRMNGTLGECDPLWNNLAGYWPIEAGTGTDVFDASQNDAHGVATNPLVWNTNTPLLSNNCGLQGCMDSTACNFDSNATADDGSCLYFDACGICGGNSNSGCMDTTACNYDSSASCDNGTCVFPGCTDAMAVNYDSNAGCDDGTCSYSGCTYSWACNYNPLALEDDGTCGIPGCMDSSAMNYNSNAVCDDASCVYPPNIMEDLNFDCEVNTADLILFLGAFGYVCP